MSPKAIILCLLLTLLAGVFSLAQPEARRSASASDKVEQVKRFKVSQTSQRQNKTEDSPMNITLLAAIISAVAAITVGVMTYIHNRRLLRESRLAERRKAIDRALNELYGPLYSYLTLIKGLYGLFKTGKP